MFMNLYYFLDVCVYKCNKYTINSIDYFWKYKSPTVNFIKIFWSFHIKVWIICTIILKEILSNNVNVIVNALILDHRKEKYKKFKTKIFCKVLYRYANNPVAAKKFFFSPIVDVGVDFCSSIFFLQKSILHLRKKYLDN